MSYHTHESEARRIEYGRLDQSATLAAIELDVHPIGCDEIPIRERMLIAAAVEGWLSDLGMRA